MNNNLKGRDNMETFYKEGKVIGFEELIDVVGEMISRKVLDSLEHEEMKKLYVKTCDVTCSAMRNYLEANDYKIVNVKQLLLTALQVKIIEDKEVWNEVVERRNMILDDTTAYTEKFQQSTGTFIKEVYYPAMKQLYYNMNK